MSVDVNSTSNWGWVNSATHLSAISWHRAPTFSGNLFQFFAHDIFDTAYCLAKGGKLVSASSPAATSVDVHEMKMDGDMMKMRAVDAVPLPAGQPVEFKPNGLHVMLTGLKAPVKAGDVVPIKLVVEDAKGKRETVDVKAVARQN